MLSLGWDCLLGFLFYFGAVLFCCVVESVVGRVCFTSVAAGASGGEVDT